MPTRNFVMGHYSGASHCCNHINNTSLFALGLLPRPNTPGKEAKNHSNRTALFHLPTIATIQNHIHGFQAQHKRRQYR
jgi:hypothetical protein